MISLFALLRLELVGSWRDGSLLLALLTFLALHGMGEAFGLGADRLFGYAYLAGLGIGLRPGLRADRANGFTSLVAISLSNPLRLSLAKILGLGAWCLAFTLGSAGIALAISGGDWGFAGWYGSTFGAVSILCILPAVSLDLLLGVRLPVLPVYLLVLLVGLVGIGAGVEPETLQAWAGLRLDPGRYGSLGPALFRGGAGLMLAWLVVWINVLPGGVRGTRLMTVFRTGVPSAGGAGTIG